jgi:hypothetical protein
MSTTITVGTGSELIHGSFTAAVAYVDAMFGDAYDVWRALSTDDKRKQTLAAAVRYLNAQAWNEDADTFAERDAIAVFAQAQYELAVIIANDASVLSAVDSGANIQSMGAGSAQIAFFAPTSVALGTATKLPTIVQRLVGSYLASAAVTGGGGYGQSGDCESPFSDCRDYNKRGAPY